MEMKTIIEKQSGEILTTEALSRHFGGLKANTDINFSLRIGEIRAIIGPNGAGKTTFFNLITGVLRPSSGKVFFKGSDITNLHPYQRVKLGIGRSFQSVNLFPDISIRENIELAVQPYYKKKTNPFEVIDRKKIKRHVQEILEKFEWEGNAQLKAGSLAHADQKKLETMLAVACNPDLLLLDEPTAGLDEEETQYVVKLIKEMAKDTTILLTDHDVQFVMDTATKISVLRQGEIIAEGSPAEITANQQVQEAYFGGGA